MRHFILLITMLLAGRSAAAQTFTIDFGTARTNLPYTEDGLTFSESALDFALIRPRFSMNSSLASASSSTGQIIRAESTMPFDLRSITVGGLYEPWRIETSAGGVFALPGLGVQDLSGRTGFSGITFFNIINNGNIINALLEVDDIQGIFVPEPSTWVLITLGLSLLSLRRSRQLVCQTNSRIDSN